MAMNRRAFFGVIAAAAVAQAVTKLPASAPPVSKLAIDFESQIMAYCEANIASMRSMSGITYESWIES